MLVDERENPSRCKIINKQKASLLLLLLITSGKQGEKKSNKPININIRKREK